MSEHTPGPWKVFRGSRHQSDRNYMAVIDSIPDVDGKVVANCICHIASTNEDAEANAKLIAAAPELLEALEKILIADYAVSRENARNAIAKAKGENK